MQQAEESALKPPAVQRPLLQGHQWVSALWFPADWFTEEERARRLLAHWQTGATVLRFAQGDLLRYASAQEQWCESLGGWPLRQQGSSLCSAPLSQREAASLPRADLWLVQGAQVNALNFSDAKALDPSSWLAIAKHALHDTYDCRAALPEPISLAPADARDLREVLNGRVPPASDDQRDFLRALAADSQRATKDGRPSERSHTGTTSATRWASVAAIAAAVIALVAFLASGDHNLDSRAGSFNPFPIIAMVGLGFLVRSALGRNSARTSAPSPRQNATAFPERGRAAVKKQAWREWLSRLAITSQVSRLLGRRQAAYMRKMLQLFESGQLEEALRHAIPLGGDKGSLGQAFGTPSARQDLALSRQPRALTSIQLGEDLDAYLRRLYRQSFEKLDREGRIDEAVFVLAELLEAKQEALDYLEKKERYQQAAELALSWDQPADVIVRLQCLAGNWRHAVAVARRDNAFATAVLQLEKRWPDAGARLRDEWAQSLAAQGDWLAAVQVIWPLALRRAVALDWLLAAEAAGGALGARALVKRALLLPDTLSDYSPQLESLRDDSASHGERVAVAEALLALKERHPRAAQLASIIAPAVLADHGAGRGRLAKNDLQRLLTLAGNAWLHADLPSSGLPGAAGQDLITRDGVLQGRLPEPGNWPILDAVTLDNGTYLVALGEAGAAILNESGKLMARFSVPAHRLVIAHSRQIALAMAPRDQAWRVSRIDIANRRTSDLGMGEFEHVAPEFDGIAWTVASGTRLRVLDTQNSLHEVLWQVTDLPGRVQALSVNAQVEQIVAVPERGKPEVWRYSLPQRRLMARGEALPERSAESSLLLLNPNGGVVDVWMQPAPDGALSLAYKLHGRTFQVAWAHPEPSQALKLTASIGGAWLVVAVIDPLRTHWHAIALGTGRIHASLVWPTEAQSHARLVHGHWVVWDAQGRIWSVDTKTCVVKGVGIR